MKNMFYLIFLILLFTQTPLLADQVCRTDLVHSKAPNSRYINYNDGTILDQRTGLMWKQCSEGLSGVGCDQGAELALTWDLALQQVANVNQSNSGFAGYSNWRLPIRNELYSLVDMSCYEPSINLDLFPNTAIREFWSSSPFTNSVNEPADSAWSVSFAIGNVDISLRDELRLVRLVRDEQ